MECPCFRQSTSHLKQIMTGLDHSINGIMFRSCLNLSLYLIGVALIMAFSRSPYITCKFLWMPTSLYLVMFAVSCFYLYNSLRLLRTYSVEMEHIAAELNKKRRRLLELGMEHDALLTEMARVLAIPAWVYLSWGVLHTLCFLVFSVPLMYAEYTFGYYPFKQVCNGQNLYPT